LQTDYQNTFTARLSSKFLPKIFFINYAITRQICRCTTLYNINVNIRKPSTHETCIVISYKSQVV